MSKMSSDSNTKQYFAKRVWALKGTGGGHTSYTAQLEKCDNSMVDSFLRANKRGEVIIAYSPKNNVLVDMDNGYGTEDIKSVWGSGDLVRKDGHSIGRKMEGCLAGDLFWSPDTILYYSYNPIFDVKLQYGKLNTKKMFEILDEHPNMKIADEFIKVEIKVQQDKDLDELHPQWQREIFDLIRENPELMSLLEDKSQSKFMTIKKGSADNSTFNSLGGELPKILSNMQLFNYNEHLRRGSKFKLINLDTGVTTEYNSETASTMHILGKYSIIRIEHDDKTDSESSTYTKDFGRVDLNKVHILYVERYIKTIDKSQNSSSPDKEKCVKSFVVYKNFGKFFEYDENTKEIINIKLESYLKKCKKLEDEGHKKEECRCYITCLSDIERKEQMKSILVKTEELRKLSVLTNTGNGVRGLSRVDYPELWSLHLRNLKAITVAIVVDGESENSLTYSANKSNIKLDTFNPEFLAILKSTLVPIIKEYDQKKQQHNNGEDTIKKQSKRFLEPFGITFKSKTPIKEFTIDSPVISATNSVISATNSVISAANPHQQPAPNLNSKPEPKLPRVESKKKNEVIELLNIMSSEDIEKNQKNFDEVITGSLRHLSPQQRYAILKIQLDMMPNDYNPVIKDGHKLNV